MYSLIIENKDGLQLEFNNIGAAYNITNAQGLSPAKNTINTNTAALIDGGTFNSAKVNMRSINIAFTIEYPVEANRLNVYKVLRAKEPITLYYKSNALDVFIEGYVESLDIGHFDMKQKATVAILCPFPYWKNAQQIINELSVITSMFHFPFHAPQSKNLLPYPYYQTTRTAYGISYTDNGDGSITINGTSTSSATTAFVCRSRDNESFRLPIGNYILSGGIDQTRRIVINYMKSGASAATSIAVSAGADAPFTITEELSQVDLQVGIYTSVGGSWDNVTVYPMIRSASVASDTWQPYDYKTIVFGSINTEAQAVVVNNGGIETGLTFELYAKDAISNPKIFDYITQDYIGLNFSMQTGDLIIIDTTIGQKSVTLIRNAQATNIFNSLQKGSTWLQLAAGGSVFVYQVDSGSPQSLEIDIKHFDLYEGV